MFLSKHAENFELLVLQEMQSDRDKLEKMLRIVKQERNALAATLRQHGFLGKQSRSNCGLQASSHEQQQQKAQADTKKQGSQISCTKYGDLASNIDVVQASLDSPCSHGQAQEANDLRAVPSPELSAANASYSSHPCEARCLRDTTNATTSTVASPAAKSSFQSAAHMHHHWSYRAKLSNSPAHEAQAMQARLHELEQMAQELLL